MVGVPAAVVLMDPADGKDSKWRAGISELGVPYAGGVLPTSTVSQPGEAPMPPPPRLGRGRSARRSCCDATHRSVSAKTLALELAVDAWQTITWRNGSNTPLASRLAPVAGAPGLRRRQPE